MTVQVAHTNVCNAKKSKKKKQSNDYDSKNRDKTTATGKQASEKANEQASPKKHGHIRRYNNQQQHDHHNEDPDNPDLNNQIHVFIPSTSTSRRKHCQAGNAWYVVRSIQACSSIITYHVLYYRT